MESLSSEQRELALDILIDIQSAIERIREQLQRELPGLKGFGEKQLRNMRTFYETWSCYFNSVATATKLKSTDSQDVIDVLALQHAIRQPLAIV